jgi:hypothetical protein
MNDPFYFELDFEAFQVFLESLPSPSQKEAAIRAITALCSISEELEIFGLGQRFLGQENAAKLRTLLGVNEQTYKAMQSIQLDGGSLSELHEVLTKDGSE